MHPNSMRSMVSTTTGGDRPSPQKMNAAMALASCHQQWKELSKGASSSAIGGSSVSNSMLHLHHHHMHPYSSVSKSPATAMLIPHRPRHPDEAPPNNIGASSSDAMHTPQNAVLLLSEQLRLGGMGAVMPSPPRSVLPEPSPKGRNFGSGSQLVAHQASDAFTSIGSSLQGHPRTPPSGVMNMSPNTPQVGSYILGAQKAAQQQQQHQQQKQQQAELSQRCLWLVSELEQTLYQFLDEAEPMCGVTGTKRGSTGIPRQESEALREAIGRSLRQKTESPPSQKSSGQSGQESGSAETNVQTLTVRRRSSSQQQPSELLTPLSTALLPPVAPSAPAAAGGGPLGPLPTTPGGSNDSTPSNAPPVVATVHSGTIVANDSIVMMPRPPTSSRSPQQQQDNEKHHQRASIVGLHCSPQQPSTAPTTTVGGSEGVLHRHDEEPNVLPLMVVLPPVATGENDLNHTQNETGLTMDQSLFCGGGPLPMTNTSTPQSIGLPPRELDPKLGTLLLDLREGVGPLFEALRTILEEGARPLQHGGGGSSAASSARSVAAAVAASNTVLPGTPSSTATAVGSGGTAANRWSILSSMGCSMAESVVVAQLDPANAPAGGGGGIPQVTSFESSVAPPPVGDTSGVRSDMSKSTPSVHPQPQPQYVVIGPASPWFEASSSASAAGAYYAFNHRRQRTSGSAASPLLAAHRMGFGSAANHHSAASPYSSFSSLLQFQHGLGGTGSTIPQGPVRVDSIGSMASLGATRGAFPVTDTNVASRTKDDDTGFKMLNQFIMMDTLGQGACGKVKLAFDLQRNVSVAIKIVRRRRSSVTSGPSSISPSAVHDTSQSTELQNPNQRLARKADAKEASLLHEVAVMKKLRHKNIVTLHEVIDDPEAEKLYLVMQYVDKGPLATVQRDGTCSVRIPPERLAHVGRQVAAGLEYLHSKGVVHRDVKPENLLVDSSDRVYLADFGVSDVFAATTGTPTNDDGMTFRGTPLFMAPELMLSGSVEMDTNPLATYSSSSKGSSSAEGEAWYLRTKLDMWSLGVTLYFLLYGRSPFDPEEAGNVLLPAGELFTRYDGDVQWGTCHSTAPVWHRLLGSLLSKTPKTRPSAGRCRGKFKELVAIYRRRGSQEEMGEDHTSPLVRLSSATIPAPGGGGKEEHSPHPPPLSALPPHRRGTVAFPTAQDDGDGDAGEMSLQRALQPIVIESNDLEGAITTGTMHDMMNEFSPASPLSGRRSVYQPSPMEQTSYFPQGPASSAGAAFGSVGPSSAALTAPAPMFPPIMMRRSFRLT